MALLPSSGLLRWILLIELGPVIETSSINRIHLSRSEDGRRAIFRNVDCIYFIFYIFMFYILFTIKTDKVLVTSGSQYL
jgi:hypothetical protein